LSRPQLQQLTKLVCLVEDTYGMPMDIEWAFIEGSNNKTDSKELELKLLQARPITTLFTIDDKMMTPPGEKRVLYFDFNVISEATTTSPFTTLDLDLYCKCTTSLTGHKSLQEAEDKNWNMYSESADMLLFNASTRQYLNMSYVLKYMSSASLAKIYTPLDPYSASIFASYDCDRDRYRAKRIPKEMNLRRIYKFLRDGIPFWSLYNTAQKYIKNPRLAKEEYLTIIEQDKKNLDKVVKERVDSSGLYHSSTFTKYFEVLCDTIANSLKEELGAIMFVVLSTFKDLDKKRRDETKSKKVRDEYEALCGGYEGDELMEMNIEMHKLAQKLPIEIWKQYDHESMNELAIRIESNLGIMLKNSNANEQEECDIPIEFLDSWTSFMNKFGYDGQDQLFVSCPRYDDSPELLLAKIRLNAVGQVVKDPSITQQEQVAKRRVAQKQQEQDAATASTMSKLIHPFALSKIKKRNEFLEHVMWMRNAPKLHAAKIIGLIRADTLRIQDKLLESGRLEEEGDIFHLNIKEIDKAIIDSKFELIDIIRPRKVTYERARCATICPLLVDSRCRILLPDPPTFKEGEEPEPGTLIGSAVAPGIATGRVRILNQPNEKFESGEVLCATVTGPAWTPLFASASAVVLQIGGVLQHGALCAREYGKPAVSNIDIHTVLKNGMKVSVDGNTGIVKILDDDDDDHE